MNKDIAPVGKDARLVQQTLTLTSLAILKVDIDEHHRNYIDYLAQFVLSVLASHRPEFVTDSKVAELLKDDFGLLVPTKAVQHVLRKLARDGHVRKEHEAYYPAAKLPEVGIAAKRLDAASQIQRVFDALCKFSSSIHPEAPWSDVDASKAVLGFLARFTVDCLKSYVFNTALPLVPDTGAKDLYIVSRFLQQCHEADRPLFEDFIVLVKGQMYANALTCPDLESLEKKFNNVTFYLDTPLILSLMSLQGEGLRQAAAELTTLVRDLKGSLEVFSHTLDEVRGVLRYAARNFDNPQVTSRILREMRNSGTTLSDLYVYIEQLPERLATFHIRVRATPEYESDFQIDETTFHVVLEDGIRYTRDHALENDINSVRSIYVLRRGVSPARLEDAVAIFVTPNPALARVAFEFGKTHNSSKEVSSVITDYSLANVAWLKAPMKRPSLPEKETLALCYAALEPSKALFRKYVEMMEQLRTTGNISEQDHAILRLSPVAQRELMDVTLGDETALTGIGLKEVLSRVKESLVEEQKALAAAERAIVEDQLANAHLSLEAQAKAYNEATLRQQELGRIADEEKATLREDQQRIVLIAARRAKSFSKVMTISLMTAISALLLLGAFAGAGLLAQTALTTSMFGYLLPVTTFIAVVWGWYSWLTGNTIRGITQQIEYSVTLRIFSWLTGKSTLPEESIRSG
ncbi:MAG: hypothetical protein KBA96_10900 [Rhodocyclaceae bacterium]|nr:hypothetical protein [Rhodocyclaceae bacterium]MBP7081611.1 hypothetical protein [Rhodocyclaceae bacterium]